MLGMYHCAYVETCWGCSTALMLKHAGDVSLRLYLTAEEAPIPKDIIKSVFIYESALKCCSGYRFDGVEEIIHQNWLSDSCQQQKFKSNNNLDQMELHPKF